MKTLMIITGGLGTGGLERISCFVANKFCKRGWKVVVLTLLQKESESRSFQNLNQDVDVIQFFGKNDPLKHKILSIKIWKKMIKDNINKYKPDSILAMTFKIASMVCLFSRKYAKKVTVREISDPKSKTRSPFVNLLTEFLCRKVKNIIFQTNWEKSCYHKKIQSKGLVIPNPLSITLKKTGQFSEKKFFTLSRLLINQKRQDILIKAFDLFFEKHSDYKLEIYGKGEDKNLLEAMISDLKCRNSINIFDPVPNIHEKVLNYRGFILTSDFEGMSNALLECYSLGIPCISSDWPGVEDIITNNIDGLIYKRQNVSNLFLKMNELCNSDKFCFDLTKNALANSSRFKEEVIIERYCEAIESA